MEALKGSIWGGFDLVYTTQLQHVTIAFHTRVALWTPRKPCVTVDQRASDSSCPQSHTKELSVTSSLTDEKQNKNKINHLKDISIKETEIYVSNRTSEYSMIFLLPRSLLFSPVTHTHLPAHVYVHIYTSTCVMHTPILHATLISHLLILSPPHLVSSLSFLMCSWCALSLNLSIAPPTHNFLWDISTFQAVYQSHVFFLKTPRPRPTGAPASLQTAGH